MTTFDDRKNAFENKFAHDAEMQFRAHARSNKMLGLWAAQLLGKTGAEAEAYAMEVLKADFAEVGQEDVFRKLSKDLDYRADELTIRAKMAEFLGQAKAQIMDEKPEGRG
ncbi:MAG TPA: DUF1476 domain-containing protein [Amaricoccus sp.]|uniref:DUF1476 domain-containing protein n=1 Tax=Amaricoccus sp. TaxID=1872485 RepID=UPI002BE78CC8|nr:DUF1476 domain-containing protein [Amaricoccus sp.]HRO13004.1 DUF1476 domain-containing protein [Amaricoccus sp.]